MNRSPLLAAFALVLAAASAPAADPAFTLNKGDTVAVVGNTFADRMQHDGWFDAYLHTRFPEHNLRVRHLGYSADEVGGYTSKPNPDKRLRSASFGTGDEWLTRVKADAVFAFFGYNESFAGKDGLEAFKVDLADFIKHTKGQKYNGKAAPQVVLFGPIAQENLNDPNLPDGKENNKRIAMYSLAMKEVAAKEGVPFVELFSASQNLYAATDKPLTSNGIHPTEFGYKALVPVMDAELFGAEVKRDTATLEAVRKAAADRNFHWYERYRTTDGYSVYGGRADLKFVGGQTNRVVAQRELEILDEMTALRDEKVNAVARGKEYTVDDTKTAAFIPVPTNKPGAGPGGKHLFLSGEQGIAKMTVGKNLKVNLFADEGMFPEMVNPVQMAWDARGRLWVATWQDYPHWTPKQPMNDKLIVLEDTDGDGKADKCTVFADHLDNPTGFEFYNGGVILAQAPDLVFLKDTDGDGKADVRQVLLSGLDTADTHHTSNSFVLGPGGDLHFQEGTFHHTQVETPYGPPERVANGSVFRYEPRTGRFGVYVSYGFANPHGHVFDKWGQDIVVDGTGANPYHGVLFSGHLPYPQKHKGTPQVYQPRTRPCGGIEILSSGHFPADFRNNLIVTNCIGFQGVMRVRIDDNGASLKGTELEPFVSSTDPNFRPVDAKVGPDGAIYVADWHNPIIGHMQHNLRDPSRDKEHGRIYRISYEGAEPLKPVKVAGEKIEALLDLLKATDDRVRSRAKIELGGCDTKEVIAATQKWAAALDPADADYEHNRLEALWVHEYHNVPNPELLAQVLASKSMNARAAAARVLVHWRDRIPDALGTLKKLAADDAARVRLMAVWGASYFTEPEAIEVVLVAGEKPKDQFVDFVSGETTRALTPYVQKAIASKTPIRFTTPAGARYFLKSLATDDLLKVDRTPPVYTELLHRKGVRDDVRKEAAAVLAKAGQGTEAGVLLDVLKYEDTAAQDESVAFDTVRLLTDRKADLPAVRPELEKLALSAKTPMVRQLGWAAVVAADDSPEKAWATASQSVNGLKDFVAAVPMIRNPLHTAALYPKLLPLLDGLPKPLQGNAAKTVTGRVVRIELPGPQRTLTLAEVEVYSDGKNVARGGKATQSSTSNGGVAEHAIDGNTSGSYADGGQTHTKEGTQDPWWQVDLGADYPIDSVVVFNRTDTNLSARLNGFTLKVLDKDKKEVFAKAGFPAPPEGKGLIPVGGESPERVVRRAAMVALTAVRGKEADTFAAVARFVGGDEREAAIQALQRIKASEWPKAQAGPLLAKLTEYVASVPQKDRTAPAVVDALQFADELAGLLPKDQAKKVKAALGELGVRVIRVGTLTDQMLFDKDRIVVQAGKPVEFVFQNTDIMPHNFVIVQPGTLAEVGEAGEVFGTQPGAQEKNFVPPSDKIMLASKLLQPQTSQPLKFTAPVKAGVYPFVCTYPGHWRRMYGALYVVDSLDDYAENPEAYVKEHKLAPQDEYLKFIGPRTEWKLDLLAPAVVELEKGGRSFARGKQLFTVASCVSCHKFDGTGQDFGPDLTKLDAKDFKGAADVLKHVLDPSLKIDDKYRTYRFDLAAGGSVTGMVTEKTADGDYKVIENPLLKAEAKLIRKNDLDGEPKRMEQSIMPKGLLDKLNKDEILDLLAYVWAKGDPKGKYFEGGHDHGGHGH